jgi:hypothetical protein
LLCRYCRSIKISHIRTYSCHWWTYAQHAKENIHINAWFDYYQNYLALS